ncbi:MAG TPA: class I SAM-dependent methyltransferase [Candidatus Acidoferrum sp.]|nr:class I SAM-dependent methyltransferase [Candidatus Acidoferrum sp.]
MSNASTQTVNTKQPWDRFAEADPYTYILTSLKNRDMKQFWQSGEIIVVREILPLLQERQISTGVALELGCGVGRLVIPLAPSFGEIWGADVAEGMIRRAQIFAAGRGIRNARFTAVANPEALFDRMRGCLRRVDFIYSLLVFQHIPDLALIGRYLGFIRTMLRDSGIAYLQFDTRPKTWAYHAKSALPDFLLPRFWRKGIRRIRRAPEELEESFRFAGLEIVDELTPRTEYHRYILRRASEPAP